MQDFQPLHGRIFCSGGGTADGGGGRAELRRILGYPAMSPRQQQPPPTAKCPRCDSVNTKFCYYNNYNLSQPRHFCKSCRRYWTMGGVLRNVPVGGGCRKSKRPSSKPTLDTADKDQLRRRRPPSAFRSSSDSSSLSATATPASASVNSTTTTSLPDPAQLANQISTSNPNPQYDQLPDVGAPLCSAADVFQDPAAGVFTGTPAALLGFGFHDPPPAQERGEVIRPEEFADQTIPVDPRPSSGDGDGDGIASLDWSGQVDPTFYDLTCAVDPSSYWNPSHWSDPDPSLYLP